LLSGVSLSRDQVHVAQQEGHNQEHLYPDRKDVVDPIHFTTPPPLPQQSASPTSTTMAAVAIEQQQLKCFSDEVDSHGSTELNGASV